MEQLGTAFLAGTQKSHGLDIHKRHSVKIQHNPRLITVHLRLQFIEMLRSQSTAQANDFLLPIANLFQSSMSFATSVTWTTTENAMKRPRVTF